MKGFKGDPEDQDGFRVLLHDGKFWVEASVIDSYRTYIQEKKMPDVGDLVQIRQTLGGPTNLLIVRCFVFL